MRNEVLLVWGLLRLAPIKLLSELSTEVLLLQLKQ